MGESKQEVTKIISRNQFSCFPIEGIGNTLGIRQQKYHCLWEFDRALENRGWILDA